MNRPSRLALIALTLLIAVPASATEAGDPSPRRQFDFWVGTWDVFGPDGKKAGENTIELQLDGNLLVESWRGAGGGEGRSMNYWDPAKQRWVQVWVDRGGGVIPTEGGFEDGAMRLTGTHVLPSGEVRAFRMTFTPKPDGKIHQFIEESTDDGKTWSTWFDGIYVRKGE